MLLFLVLCIVFVVSLLAAALWMDEIGPKGAVSAICCVLTILMTIPILLSIAAMSNAHWNWDGELKALEEEKTILEYQLQKELYLNDNNVGSVELFDRINEFNTDVMANKRGLRNPWISAYYSPAYYDIEPIDIKEGIR